MAIVFVEVGQDVHITGGLLEDAVNEGVRQGYVDGYLRLSVVRDPLLDRSNTNDNTPAILYTRVVAGDEIHVTVEPKGFGSENMSALKMFTPAAKPVSERCTVSLRDFFIKNTQAAPSDVPRNGIRIP